MTACWIQTSLRPRRWQTHLIQLLRRRLDGGAISEQDVLVFAGPGAGKTLGALLAFRSIRQEQRLQRCLVFCHRTSILHQWLRAAARLSPEAGQLAVEPEEVAEGVRMALLTYRVARQPQQLATESGALDWHAPVAIADEAHHLGVDPDEPDGLAWGQAFLEERRSRRLRLGLTGTPFRADNLAFCAARRIRTVQNGMTVEQIQPDLCVEPRELIAAGDVRPLEFHFQDGWVEHAREGRPGP